MWEGKWNGGKNLMSYWIPNRRPVQNCFQKDTHRQTPDDLGRDVPQLPQPHLFRKKEKNVPTTALFHPKKEVRPQPAVQMACNRNSFFSRTGNDAQCAKEKTPLPIPSFPWGPFPCKASIHLDPTNPPPIPFLSRSSVRPIPSRFCMERGVVGIHFFPSHPPSFPIPVDIASCAVVCRHKFLLHPCCPYQGKEIDEYSEITTTRL